MNYREYCGARNAAWKILVDFKVDRLPVKVVALCREMGIEVKYYVSENKDDGRCTILEGVPYIFVNESAGRARQRFTVAHELGHIVLGHVGEYALTNREPSFADNEIEQAANVFASRLLAPSCVLHEIGVGSAEDVAALCGISLQSARYRFSRLCELEAREKTFREKTGRGCFYQDPLEIEVRRQFDAFIRECRGERLR